MTSTHLVAHHLRRTFRGPVHVPAELDETGPGVVAVAQGAADVQAALLTARQHDLPFVVHATGHGTHVPFDGALVLETGGRAEVLVAPDRRTARVGPGARWR